VSDAPRYAAPYLIACPECGAAKNRLCAGATLHTSRVQAALTEIVDRAATKAGRRPTLFDDEDGEFRPIRNTRPL
jgi:hypothetical protein